jgi:hypothetical protein
MHAKDADFVENLFVLTVGAPLVVLGATGLWFATFTTNDVLPAKAHNTYDTSHS